MCLETMACQAALALATLHDTALIYVTYVLDIAWQASGVYVYIVKASNLRAQLA